MRPFNRATPSLPTHARDYNRAAVLQRVFRQGPMSRADLAREIGLTKVTVSALVADLLDEGLLAETGQDVRPGKPGKRPTMLVLCEDRRRIVAVDLTRDGRLAGAIMTLTGERIERRQRTEPLALGDEGVEELAQFCADLIADAEVPVIGVGVSSPGVVTADGTIIRAPKRGWHNLPLQDMLAARLGLPVTVANDANCASLGEFAFGETRGDVVLSVLVGDGMGAGLSISGSLVLGSASAAGEIAHVTATREPDDVLGDPLLCACGRFGCLETLLSESELRRALAGREPASRAAYLTAVGTRLGRVLAPCVALLDLSDIVVSGPADLFEGPLIDAATTAIGDNVWSGMNTIPAVGLSQLDDRAPLIGASVLVLSNVLGIP